jgi:hypothetical protein
MNIYEKLSNIQNELKAPKGQFNKFGGYKYRSCEDILEAVKPICKKYKTVLVLSDSIVVLGDGNTRIIEDDEERTRRQICNGQRFYVQATARLTDIEANKESEDTCISNTAYAREEENKKGMDGSQITGTASSYARKYALNGLFNIDDTKDADTDEFTKQQQIDDDKVIDKTKVQALNKSIENAGIKDDVVELILSGYGYTSTSEIKVKDYANLVNDFKSKVKE